MGTRACIFHGGWEVWVHGGGTLLLYIMSNLIWYNIMCFVEITCGYIYLSYTYTMCNTIQEYGFCSYSCDFITLFKLLLHFTLILNQVKHYIIYLFNSTK